MKNIFVLVMLLCSCTPFTAGSGSSFATTRPSICLSDSEYLRLRKALSRCKRAKERLKTTRRDLLSSKIDHEFCKGASKKLMVDLDQCRRERDRKRKAPPSKFWDGVLWGAGAAVLSCAVLVIVILVR
jgi:hypothetical protein